MVMEADVLNKLVFQICSQRQPEFDAPSPRSLSSPFILSSSPPPLSSSSPSPSSSSSPLTSSSPLDLHPLLHQLFQVGCRLLDQSLDVVFRKEMRGRLLMLNDKFLQAQMSRLEGPDATRNSRNDLLDHVINIGKFVKTYREPENDVRAVQCMMDIERGIQKLNESSQTLVFEPRVSNKCHSQTIERLIESVKSFQANQIHVEDLDNRTYKRIESTVNEIKDKALGGTKDVTAWWNLVHEVDQMADVGRVLISSCTMCLTVLSFAEKNRLGTHLQNMGQLLSAYQECVHRILHLDVDYADYMDQVAVLLINSMFVVRKVLDTELCLWNPVPRNVFCGLASKTSRNQSHQKWMKLLLEQVEMLTNIFNISPTSVSNGYINHRNNFITLQKCCGHMSTKSANNSKIVSLNGDDTTWQNCVYTMFTMVHHAFKTIFLLVDASDLSNVNLLHDWTKTNDVIKHLTNKIDDKMLEIKCSLGNDDDEEKGGNGKLTFRNKTSKDRSILKDGWTDQLERMKALLHAYAPQSPSSLLSLPPPMTSSSLLLTTSSTSLSSSPFVRYPFDEDCLKLVILLCKIQLSKSDKVILEDARRSGNIPGFLPGYHGKTSFPSSLTFNNNNNNNYNNNNNNNNNNNYNNNNNIDNNNNKYKNKYNNETPTTDNEYANVVKDHEAVRLLSKIKSEIEKFIDEASNLRDGDELDPSLNIWLDETMNKDIKTLDDYITVTSSVDSDVTRNGAVTTSLQKPSTEMRSSWQLMISLITQLDIMVKLKDLSYSDDVADNKSILSSLINVDQVLNNLLRMIDKKNDHRVKQ